MDAAAGVFNLLIFHISGPGHVMLPLDQSRFFADIDPDSIHKTIILIWIGTRHSGLLLDRLEKFVLVDFAVKLSENILALVVMYFWRTIARHLIKLIVFIWRGRQVYFIKTDVLFHEDTWAWRLEIWASFRIFGQFLKVDL